MNSRFTLLAGVLGLIGFLSIVGTPPPAFADSAPKADRAWGEASYEAEKSRYEKRVQFYETEYAKLQGHGQLINNRLNVFFFNDDAIWKKLFGTTKNDYIRQFDTSFEGRKFLRRLTPLKEDENEAYKYHHNYASLNIDLNDKYHREKRYTYHLDYLHNRNARTLLENKYLDSRLFWIKAKVGFNFDEWMIDNHNDFVYAVDKVMKDAIKDFYKDCIGGQIKDYFADNLLLKLRKINPTSWADRAKGCVSSVGFGALANSLKYVWQKQLIDDMVGEDIHKEVAQYWVSDLLDPADDKNKKSLRKFLEEYHASIRGDVESQTIRAIERIAKEDSNFRDAIIKQIKNNLKKNFNSKSIADSLKKDGGLKKLQEKALKTMMNRRRVDIMRRVEKYSNALVVSNILGKYIQQVLPQIVAYRDIGDLKNEKGRYWFIRKCLEKQESRVRGSAIIAILKRNDTDYKKFIRKCKALNQDNAVPPADENKDEDTETDPNEEDKRQAEEAQKALDACRFKDSQRLIINLPKGPSRSALSAKWNKAYNAERQARELRKNAIALAKEKRFEAALEGLHQALRVPPTCEKTVSKINSAISKIKELMDKAGSEDIQAAIAACQFKKSRGMISKLPKGPSRSALSAKWNKAYNAERQARQLRKNAIALARQKRFKAALEGLHQALRIPPTCEKTVAKINSAISKINNRKVASPENCPQYQEWHKFLGKCASAYDFNMYCKRKHPGSIPSSKSKSLCVCPSGTRPSKKTGGCVKNTRSPKGQLTKKRVCPKRSKRKEFMIDSNGIPKDGTHIICQYCRPSNALSLQWHFRNGKMLLSDKFQWPCKKKTRPRKPGNFKKLKNFGDALKRGAH